MKRHTTIIFFILAFALSNFAQSKDLQTVLKSVVDHAKEASLYQDTVDWKKLEPEVYSKAANAKTVEDLVPAFNHLLGELGDFHGKIIYKNRPIAFGRRKKPVPRPDIKADIWSRFQSARMSVETKLLEDQIGYIRIPAMPMGDNLKMSKEIREAVCGLKAQKADKWILDLRYNGGGNMYPMFEGIAEILGEGIVAGTQSSNGKQVSTWKIKDSDFYYDEYRAVELPNKCSSNTLPKVAVLTSPYTASSGEAVAVAFKNRPNTKFFGAKTAGYTTVTDWTELDKGLFMTISISYYADRTGVAYQKYVEADVPTKFFLPKESESDIAIQKARKWLIGDNNNIASNEEDRSELKKVFSDAIKAVGGKNAISKIKSIEAFADCIGPKGKYKTEIASFRDNKTHFKQTFEYRDEVSDTFINGNIAWQISNKTGEFEVVSPFQKLVVNLHEYQKMAFDFQKMFTDFELIGDRVFNKKLSVKVSAKNNLGGTIYLFFDKETKLLSGYILPIPNSKETVKNVFQEWKTFGKIKLPSKVKAIDSGGDWILDFNIIDLNQADEKALNIPPIVEDLAELLRLHKEHQTAHLTYDPELFIKSFADKLPQIQSGRIRTGTKEENLARFKKYFSSYKFLEWEDINPPVIKISKDGTLATKIVEKRVRGTYKNDKGVEESDHTIFAWLEVWEKIDGKWKVVTVASTSRNGAKKK